MQKPWRMAIVLSVVALVAGMLGTVFYTATVAAVESTRQEEQIIFTVGGQDQMKTRNWLPAIANDVWTSDVLGRVYDTVGQTHPVTDALVPYILKGVDDNGDTNFQRSEKGDFLKGPCPAPCTDEVAWRRTVWAYYDFNGVKYHDGTQATIGDVYFNYVMQSLNPRFNTDMRVLWDDPNAASLPPTRHLNVFHEGCNPTDAEWEGASTMPGNNNLRCAVRFQLQDDFALFYRSTLAGLTLFPRHIFEGTGSGHHPLGADWGLAVYPETDARFGQGIPTTETTYTPFNYNLAEGWGMLDADVIGTGPFRFGTWSFGAFARVDKNPDFFWGVDPANPTVVLDPDLVGYIHPPTIDAILYKVYRTTQLGVFALESGEIDFYHWNVPPEFVPDLLNNPNVRVWSNAEPGFFYLSYNMRRVPYGYTAYPPASRGDDMGLPLRQAIAHLIDKSTIVRTLLQNYGVIADGTVSPANTFWYNATLRKYDYDPVEAGLILDNAGWVDTPGDCQVDGTGCRSLPNIGTRLTEILTPQADYDPIRASAGAMIAAAARSVGLNINSKPTAFGAIVQAIDARDFDMFILGWRISGTDPDYLFSFFHSSNAAAGQNYPGLWDAEFDDVILDSRKELDEGVRQTLVKRAQGILSEQLPYDVLYYRTNIEAQRVDRFVNYSVASGTIWNYWSLLSIQRPTTDFIRAVVATPSAAVEGGSISVSVTVRDQDGAAVQGASVTLSVNAGSGQFVGGTCTSSACTITGTTGSTGTYTATYQAPSPAPANQDVEIRVTARSGTLPVEQRTAIVTVFPVGVQFLSLTPRLTTGDLVPTGESLVFGLEVRDQDGSLASGSSVDLTVTPTSATVSPASGTGSTMQSGIVFQAPATIPASPANFQVEATATLAGHQDATTNFQFTVVEFQDTVRCPDGSEVPIGTSCPTGPSVPALGVLPILATLGVAAVVYAVIRQRKKGE